MPYLGQSPKESFSAAISQTITGTGATSYSLTKAVNNPEDLEVFINNVQQQPTTSYTVSGSTITFDEALLSTDSCYVVFRSVTQTTRSVNTATINNDAVTFAKTTFADSDTGALIPPKGTTAQRPSPPADGMIRFNTTDDVTEEYRGGAWKSLSNVFTASGGTETTITQGGNTYKVHTFLTSANFVVEAGSANVEYLVVAGGGSGGIQHSGGGGAGGLRTNVPGAASGGGGSAEASVQLAAGTYAVTIGAGGARNTSLGNNNGTRGNNGGNSSVAFTSTITSTGGGRGGRYSNVSGDAGGSGGGGGTDSSSGGAGTANQGYAGGSPYAHGSAGGGGGGGGGAGAVGVSASGSGATGDGGIGVQSSIDGTTYYYAGGGGGARVIPSGLNGSRSGNGGNGGGGGAGDGSSSSPVRGVGGAGRNAGADGIPNGGNGSSAGASEGGAGGANTGGGGGSSGRFDSLAGNGGSGIVIIRYQV